MHSILAARTDFSVGESILDVETLIKIALDKGEKTVAITDTMSVTAMIDFTNKAKKAEVKPIIGTRLRLSDNPTWRPGADEKKKHMPRDYYLTVYVRDEIGMAAVFRLLSFANSSARFYYEARLGFEDLYAELTKIGPDHLAIVLGEERSVLEHPEFKVIAERLHGLCDLVFAPLIPVQTAYFGRICALSLELIDLGLAKPLVVRPALYAPGDADAQEVMRAISENHQITDGFFRSRFNRDIHPVDMAELASDCVWMVNHLRKRGIAIKGQVFSEGMRNSDLLADGVTYLWKKAPVSLPQMAPDEFLEVTKLSVAGWKARFGRDYFGHRPTNEDLEKVYRPRLAYELSVLKKLNFSGYFLLVHDIVQFAKTNGILVGPGRGSVGGSLVAYLMGITDCDPIRFGLLFERFINPDRIDLPDADLDFMSQRRHEIVDYLIGKYGAARVAGVSNFGTLAAASAIRDVSRVVGLPDREYSISKLVPKLHGANVSLEDCAAQVPEIGAFSTKYATLWPIMLSVENKVRNLAQHAAGMVVSGVDLVERAVVETRTATVVNWDKRIVEDQGLVKVDILGLKTLDLIKLALDYIRERHGVTPDIAGMPLDDKDALDKFAIGQTVGVFQFESGGMRRLLRELGASGTITFDDITAATALYRPGPMESGMMDSFYMRKQGREPVDYMHEKLEPVLKDTFGVIVYQEQVMQISRVLAGYSGAEADKLRKIMGKKLPEEMRKERGHFVGGCMTEIYEVDLDNGQTVTLRSDKKYAVEEGGYYSVQDIEIHEYSICFPIVSE